MSRSPKSASQARRKPPKRESYDRILIVCEGRKTEPVYLKTLCKDLKISSANITISGECGSDPLSVINTAIAEFNQDRKQGNQYDSVFCVIDRDQHPKYLTALEKARDTPKPKIHVVTSIPCFEYWILLHFVYTTQSFQANQSNCNAVLKKLKEHLPDYKKGDGLEVIYLTKLKAKQADAIKNAARAVQVHQNSGGDWNASTHMHVLVEYLQQVKSKTDGKKVQSQIKKTANDLEFVSYLAVI